MRFIPAANPKQFLEMLERGEIDLTPFLALTPERRAAGLATSPLGAYMLSVYVRQDSQLDEIEDLTAKRIGVVIGAVAARAAQMLPQVSLKQYQSSDALLMSLLRGEIDAVVAVSETFEERLRKSFIEDKVRRLEPPLAITPYGLIVRRDLPRVHSTLEAAITRTVTDETMKELHTKWFGLDRSIIEHPWFGNVAMIVGGIALSTFSLGVYTVRLRRRSLLLRAENSANQLLIDAFDQMRAAITIFDVDMQAIHWNSGFVTCFPELVPRLENGATLAQVCIDFYRSEEFLDDEISVEAFRLAQAMAQNLRAGGTEQRVVHTQKGPSFDLSLFPLGARYYAAIWVDVTELHQQKEQLSAQSAELVRKNQQLLAFSAMAAHDLIAPLVQQKMLVQFITEDLLEAKLSLPADAKEHFEILGDLSGRMSLLVSDLLDYAKADSGHSKAERFVPNERLTGIVKMAAPAPEMKIVVMPGIPAVEGEPTCFDLVMRNLITNAAKHHDNPLGTITIRGYRKADNVVIEVEDDGPGIDPADRKRVFEPFARLTKTEGTGLGLAFVERTVSGWGGTIDVRSAPVRGSIFSVTLTAAPDGAVSMETAA